MVAACAGPMPVEILTVPRANGQFQVVRYPKMTNLPDDQYYTVRIIRHYPNKHSPRRQRTIAWRYMLRDPEVSETRLRQLRDMLGFEA